MSFRLQKHLWDIPDLSDLQFRVLSYYAHVADNTSFLAWPKVATVAEKCQCSARGVHKVLRELQDKKLMGKSSRRGGGSIIYQLALPGMSATKGKVIDIRTKREIEELPDFLFDDKEQAR